MKCPRCGNEMEIDSHRKIPLHMCYNCGYIEGRSTEGGEMNETNYSHLKGLNLNETAAFLAEGMKSMGLNLTEEFFVDWLMNPMS
jgi:hypothetical protein